MSTNKVYGDAPNELPLVELETRWDYADPSDHDGIDETMRIDRCLHSLFGASKVAADVMAQEYGRYFGMQTGCFRGGCLTGPNHSGVELHGFLNYLVKCDPRGRDVHDLRLQGQAGPRQHPHLRRLHGVRGVLRAPAAGEVYNLGGGRGEQRLDARGDRRASRSSPARRCKYEYVDEDREGDHICYISDIGRFRRLGSPRLGAVAILRLDTSRSWQASPPRRRRYSSTHRRVTRIARGRDEREPAQLASDARRCP